MIWPPTIRAGQVKRARFQILEGGNESMATKKKAAKKKKK
jgi:hypothetical protein